MSNSSTSEADDVDQLFQIESRCTEMRKEKDMLRQSQSQSLDLVRTLELYGNSLTLARAEDKKHIQNLEQELMNCSQEIDYLRDQLNTKNDEVSFLESKLEDMRILLDFKDHELGQSVWCIEKLEESISCLALESQCEIECMKLDMIDLEQTCFEAKKNQQEYIQQRASLDEFVENLEMQFEDAQETIMYLEKENTELRENKNGSQLDVHHLSEPGSKNLLSKEMSEDVELLISELSLAPAPEADLVKKMESMSRQIHDYEVLIKQLKVLLLQLNNYYLKIDFSHRWPTRLKWTRLSFNIVEELREEKLKAKEEAEDLAQEMAELRYQLTSLLEEECKRRSCIEQASLQRIAELEAQIKKEQSRPLAAIRHLNSA
ncbi:hypothetical protein ACFE04_025129 [Oxalis oulophora]